MAALEAINAIVGAYIQDGLIKVKIADTVGDEDQSLSGYLMEMLNTLRHETALPDHMISLKKEHIVIFLLNWDPSNGHEKGTRYVVEFKDKQRFVPANGE